MLAKFYTIVFPIDVFLFSTDEKVPAGQEVQKTEPFVPDHDPAAQGTQTLEPVPL